MPRTGTIDPKDPIAEIVQTIFGGVGVPSGIKFSMPVIIVEDLAADANVHSVQNPFDSDCLVGCIVNVTTLDATETLDVGFDGDGTSSNDKLLDGLDVGAATGVFSSFSDADTGTNGIPFVLLHKKGGTNDFLVFKATAGTDALAGQIIFILIPINEG